MSQVSYSKTILDQQSRWLLKRERWNKIITILQTILIILFSSYLTINSVGFGVGFSNMRNEIASKTTQDLIRHAKCQPPYPPIIKIMIPGFLAGCSLSEKIYKPST